MSSEQRILLDGKLYEPGMGLKVFKNKKAEEIIEIISQSGIKGRGGAGFPTGLKWKFCNSAADPEKYVISNADEGEPGTFKDRILLSKFARQHFEGMVIAGLVIKAKKGMLYLRHEYRRMKDELNTVLDQMRKDNHLGKNVMGTGIDFDIELRYGSGAYVCGEESSLIESIEGKRGEPRNKPPYTASQGYLDKPTIINNVETFCYIPLILDKGAKWFRNYGTENSPGTKIFSVSGDVEKPGVYEFNMGVTLREVLEAAGAKNTKAVQVGGASGICITEKDFDKPLSYDKDGLPPGGSVMVFDKTRDMVHILKNYIHFFYDESCGQCVPCREGTFELLRTLEKVENCQCSSKDIEKLNDLAEIMKISSKCGLGQSVANPYFSITQNFMEEFLVRDCAL